ncbi:uncharacterized protein PSFLO_02670 [Pseudozyma flocculosa]|uniref:Uncharacterized protein n=1 Tax=Pseudozyma flocculosa TaxID=84751 RepID=A0A5C3EY93_9BASI|nr:uncharacterized protein PSFLO_02670 [Pseudozyma flocculosa]
MTADYARVGRRLLVVSKEGLSRPVNGRPRPPRLMSSKLGSQAQVLEKWGTAVVDVPYELEKAEQIAPTHAPVSAWSGSGRIRGRSISHGKPPATADATGTSPNPASNGPGLAAAGEGRSGRRVANPAFRWPGQAWQTSSRSPVASCVTSAVCQAGRTRSGSHGPTVRPGPAAGPDLASTAAVPSPTAPCAEAPTARCCAILTEAGGWGAGAARSSTFPVIHASYQVTRVARAPDEVRQAAGQTTPPRHLLGSPAASLPGRPLLRSAQPGGERALKKADRNRDENTANGRRRCLGTTE